MKTKPRIPFPRFPKKLFRMAAIVLLILLCAYFLLVYFLVSHATTGNSSIMLCSFHSPICYLQHKSFNVS